MRYACPCCDYLTFEDKPSGTFDICPVCGWEDDEVQLQDPNYTGGANIVSLEQARNNFRKFGAIDKKSLSFVRQPLPEELKS